MCVHDFLQRIICHDKPAVVAEWSKSLFFIFLCAASAFLPASDLARLKDFQPGHSPYLLSSIIMLSPTDRPSHYPLSLSVHV